MKRPTYIRFALVAKDPDSHREQRILVAAYDLRDSGELSSAERSELVELLSWFSTELPVPKQILQQEQHRRAVSWFRPEAEIAISKMWELARLLESHGFQIQVLKSTDPGAILYGDAFQIVAIDKGRSR